MVLKRRFYKLFKLYVTSGTLLEPKVQNWNTVFLNCSKHDPKLIQASLGRLKNQCMNVYSEKSVKLNYLLKLIKSAKPKKNTLLFYIIIKIISPKGKQLIN